MRSGYGCRYAEYQYLLITPRLVCGRYIETAAEFLPYDYKIYCFNGITHYVGVATDRTTNA